MNKIKYPEVMIDIKKVIEDTQNNPHFKSFTVTEDNLNDCLLFLDEQQNCKDCLGLDYCRNHQKGYTMAKKGEEFQLVKCRFKEDLDAKNSQNDLIHTLYMPKSIREANLSSFALSTPERKNAFEKALTFIEKYDKNNFQKGLLLSGNFRTGKTYLLGAIANELAKKKLNSLLIYFPDLIRELKSALNTPRFDEIINELKEIDVLMIDDLGSEIMTQWVRDEIFGPVINYRLAEGKAIFISTNLTFAQFPQYFALGKEQIEQTKAMRIISRLMELVENVSFGNTPYKNL